MHRPSSSDNYTISSCISSSFSVWTRISFKLAVEVEMSWVRLIVSALSANCVDSLSDKCAFIEVFSKPLVSSRLFQAASGLNAP